MDFYQNEKMTFSEHFSELFKIIRFSALGVVMASIFLSFYIDDILGNWLDSLSLDADNFVLTTLVLSMSRFFGMVTDNESRIRIRILLICFSLILLSLPSTYNGLRIIISLLTVLFADYISRLTPIFE